MAQSKYLKQNGELIYPITLVDNILLTDTSTLSSKIVVIEDVDGIVNNGYMTLNYPTGITNTKYYLPIIQSVYKGDSILGWTGMVQQAGTSDTSCWIYIRQGTTKPADGSKIRFNAIFIKKEW